MANTIQDGSYLLAADTEELKSFEQELESAYLVGEWQILDDRSLIQAACPALENGILWST
jgi:hypothetical protein